MTSLTEILIIVAKVVFLALLFCMPVAVLLTWADRSTRGHDSGSRRT